MSFMRKLVKLWTTDFIYYKCKIYIYYKWRIIEPIGLNDENKPPKVKEVKVYVRKMTQ